VLQIFLGSVRLFLRGKLFRDSRQVLGKWLLGVGLTLTVLLVLGFAVSPRAGVILASLLGGAMQPYLFKDLKYN
jgi:hypothetical protein